MNLLIERLPQLLSLVEKWKPVKDYEDLYEVSNTGRMRSFDRGGRKGRELSPGRLKSGHLMVPLSRKGKVVRRYVHRLVVEAFRGEIPEDLVVRHITDDPDLNLLPMLEMGTRRENSEDAVRNGRCFMNNLHSSKIECPRGHDITSPLNLVPSQLKRGARACLSCHRADGNNRSRKLGLSVDSPEFQALSDEFYRATLAGFTSPKKFYAAVAATVTS